MRKQACLAVLGISIVVAAVSLGVTLTRYIGLRAYSPGTAARAGATPARQALPVTPPEEWTNLFAPVDGMKMASRLPAVNAKAGSPVPRSGFVLVGTIVSPTPSARRAILWADGMKEPKAFREKDEVEPGAILSSVERNKVWITRGKEREKLEILPVGSRSRLTAAAAPAAVSGTLSPVRGNAMAVAPPPPPGEVDEESLSPRQRRRRSRGGRL